MGPEIHDAGGGFPFLRQLGLLGVVSMQIDVGQRMPRRTGNEYIKESLALSMGKMREYNGNGSEFLRFVLGIYNLV